METADERLKILQMLDDGKISAEEATSLLRALGGGRRAAQTAPNLDGSARYLRVQVTDLGSGESKVNVTLPIGLVKAGLRMAERFAPDFGELDMDELGEMITSGVTGKIVEVVDQEDNERVDIYVE